MRAGSPYQRSNLKDFWEGKIPRLCPILSAICSRQMSTRGFCKRRLKQYYHAITYQIVHYNTTRIFLLADSRFAPSHIFQNKLFRCFAQFLDHRFQQYFTLLHHWNDNIAHWIWTRENGNSKMKPKMSWFSLLGHLLVTNELYRGRIYFQGARLAYKSL